ncbi:putative MarR family transcriptional regulator [Mobilicoccus pelagius NBRC 104925]|uniref:Putative MarR family transcriptional regulator n=1 Tax=Mobilicoccus pelagius NBRC 104925 TaxID=1089455 RepID=H5UVU3_9MICO|nr:putative MarR family transcriptional regulator [Mobilicoccus pelagius NBRC 104925]
MSGAGTGSYDEGVTPDDPAALSEAIRGVVWDVTRRLRQESEDVTDVPLAQQAVLRRLDTTPGLTSAELARAEFVRPQSMNATVTAMRRQGLVESRVAQEDARRRELHLTAEGLSLLEQIRTTRADWVQVRLETAFSRVERSALAEAVALLGRLVGDEEAIRGTHQLD